MTIAKRAAAVSPKAGVQSVPALMLEPLGLRFLAITPFERPDIRLARVLLRQQVAVAVDIGREPAAWPALLAELATLRSPRLGLRIPDHVSIDLALLPESIGFLVMAGDSAQLYDACQRFAVLAQVCSVQDAGQALCCGVAGLISKGQESGGLVGDESSFVLLQGVVAEARKLDCPVWCQGGIGFHTAAGAIAGGACGVVLDTLLAALPECSLHDDTKSQVLAMDGSEVRQIAGYQVYARGGREAEALEEMDADEVRAALAGHGPQPLLPVGQDGALVRPVMAECNSVESLVNSLRMRIAGQLRQAQALHVLDEHNAWARAHGTRYPIAQGPMTRVSDTAEFCGAVTEAGGLPFLALSLLQEGAARKLLEATRARVGKHPWGVGVLGFAPPEILNPQLELIKTIRPSVLLLAGGRPSQARPFIDLGIPTYLHVPSPGLLELFLKDGATHFVFEGRECGGHVGPRYSFVLWEQAINIMLQAERPDTLHVLFAGGIHDERSAAMVAAIAAPLAARGARIGVLMGTAYIATQEAVSCGAVLQAFQEQALSGERTVLVETAPGHAIRCLPSGFVDLFHREKNLLNKAGIDQKAVWKALEELTVGRLRIATKGVDHQDHGLVPVDISRQRAEGMYMIGQIIAQKHAVTTVAELHASVSQGATRYLAGIEAPSLSRQAHAEPVAVVGMACIYPGAPDLESYWANIVEGRDLVREVPEERWNAGQYYQAGAATAGKSPSKWGGFIDDTPFDPLQFGIPPQSLAAIEPVQLLSLAVAQRALRDAGYEAQPGKAGVSPARYFDREKTAVIFGAESGMDLANQYNFRNLYPQYCGELPTALDQALPRLTEDSFPGVLVNVISGRIANRLGLGGVNYSVDAACASSLTAVELAVKELRTGSSDMVLAGGADFHNGISDFLMFASVGALSSSGRCRSFDDTADGIALGEGVGIVVLKRLADAERDGDRIYAVIDGIAGSSDGKGLGLTAPRKEGQKRALERTYWQAGKLPSEVGLVEAHGTGTVVGDRTELRTLTEIYGAGGALPGQAGLGSVKSQIGHTKCAAGIAGLIKVAKALHHRVLPPTGQLRRPNGWYQRQSSPFSLNTVAQPWVGSRRSAAVSAFGFGGANFHALLSAYPAQQASIGAAAFPAELFVFRGETADDALRGMRQLSDFISRSTAALALRDLAYTVWQGGDGPVQCAFVATDLPALRQKLALAMVPRSGEGIVWRQAGSAGKLACLFPGQGSQYPGMLRDLFVYFPALQALLEQGGDYARVTFPPSAHDDSTRLEQQQALTDTRNAQPALGLVEMAAFQWLSALGLKPDMAAGHSFGELVALATAGAFNSADLVALARARADAILGAIGDDPGRMAAVGLGAEALQSLLADFPGVTLANQNSPVQTVISGPTPDMEAVRNFLKDRSVASKLIDTACAFHSPVVARAAETFAGVLAEQPVASLRWPVYSNSTTAAHENSAEAIRVSLASHIVSPVRFVGEVERLYADGARIFVEIGPRRVLSGLVDKILKHQPHTMITLDHEGKGLAGMLEAVAQLAVVLPAFNADALFAGRASRLDLGQPQLLPASTWMVNGGRAWPLRGEAPAHGARVVLAPVVTATPAVVEPAISESQLSVMNYLSNMRDMVNAQRDVLMSFLGANPAALPARARPEAAGPVVRAAVVPVPPASVPEAVRVPAPVLAPRGVDHRSVLLGIVGERTGYPADMLDLDLDLEADLSIDSIKRVEIVGELAEKLAIRSTLGTAADSLLEQLAQQKTLRTVLSWLTERLPAAATPAPVEQAAAVSTVHAAPVRRPSDLLLEIVADCTGYPTASLDLDLDLEADLSIDSIKRLEIVSQLTARLGLSEGHGDKDAMLEHLAGLKTLRAMTSWLEREAQPAPTASVQVVEEAEAEPASAGIPLTRYVMRIIEAPANRRASASFVGKKFVVTDDGLGIAPRVSELLRQQGADVSLISFSETSPLPPDLRNIDGLVHLWSLHPEHRVRDVKRFFKVVRESVLNRTRYLLVASGLGGDFGMIGHPGAQADFGRGAGFAGMIKSIAKEFSELRAQWVDMDLSEPVDQLASHIMAELTGQNDLTEVAYRQGQRRTRLVEAHALEAGLGAGLPLDENSVVLITGGARGITARLAIALARRYHCRLELVGRSPEPEGDESALTAGLKDARQIRQALIGADPSRKPADIERMTREILAEREFRSTMKQIRAAGSPVNYTQIDVRDIDTFAAFIESLYLLLGRIDGVIHGAGVVEDKLVRDKSLESFQRVFDTKVRGALMLNKLIRDDVRFVVFFSSVAGAFGNRGQVDYASANDVLDKLAHAWQTRISGRVLSVNWGPWADTGMVSEALEREYARKGIGLIPQADGVNALLRELASGGRGESQVVLMCGTPESFGQQPSLTARG